MGAVAVWLNERPDTVHVRLVGDSGAVLCVVGDGAVGAVAVRLNERPDTILFAGV